jgi:hypothetical protein
LNSTGSPNTSTTEFPQEVCRYLFSSKSNRHSPSETLSVENRKCYRWFVDDDFIILMTSSELSRVSQYGCFLVADFMRSTEVPPAPYACCWGDTISLASSERE